MNLFERLIYFVQNIRVEIPQPYGWFHLICLAVVLGITVLISVLFKDCEDKKFRLICLILWALIIFFEIGKQFVFCFGYNPETGIAEYNYQWYIFPYQFCSTPFYALPLVIFLKDGKVRDCAIAFVGLFVLFAGLAVMFYPNGVYTSMLYINIQTMVHHGTQVIVGVLCLVRMRKNINLLYFLKALVVFAIMAVIAILLNELVHLRVSDVFNMWFISRHFPSSLPILDGIWVKYPYGVFLLFYFIGFILVAFIINAITFGTIKLSTKLHKN